MTIYGIDVHPVYQAGLDMGLVRAEGFEFVIAKLSEGTNSDRYRGSYGWIADARAHGMTVGGYHYLRAGNERGQADVFCDALEACGNPAPCLDVEAGAGGIGGVHAFLDRCNERGHPVALLYLPPWYWEQIGRPSLAGLPPLWKSRYPSMRQAPASVLYAGTPGHYWDGYGGGNVAVLQFASTGAVAGHVVDCNAFEGSLADLHALFGGAPAAAASSSRKDEHTMKAHRLYRGMNRGRIICPVGTDTSALYGRAWVSVTGEGGGMIHYVCFQKGAPIDAPPPGAGPIWSGRIRHASRAWQPLPDRTEYIEYLIEVYGAKNENGDYVADENDPIGEVNIEFEAWQ